MIRAYLTAFAGTVCFLSIIWWIIYFEGLHPNTTPLHYPYPLNFIFMGVSIVLILGTCFLWYLSILFYAIETIEGKPK